MSLQESEKKREIFSNEIRSAQRRRIFEEKRQKLKDAIE